MKKQAYLAFCFSKSIYQTKYRLSNFQDFHLNCTGKEAVSETSTWYTVCGRRHSNYSLLLSSTAAVSTLGAMLYTYTLTYRGFRSKRKAQQSEAKSLENKAERLIEYRKQLLRIPVFSSSEDDIRFTYFVICCTLHSQIE